MGLALPTTCSFSKKEKQRMNIEMGGPIELRPARDGKRRDAGKILIALFSGLTRRYATNVMKQRGRVGLAALSVVPGREPERPEPSQYLTEDQAEIWREVTAALPPDWFRPETLPLLRPANDVAIANWSQPLSRGSFEPLR
jgi:hypothetical protein